MDDYQEQSPRPQPTRRERAAQRAAEYDFTTEARQAAEARRRPSVKGTQPRTRTQQASRDRTQQFLPARTQQVSRDRTQQVSQAPFSENSEPDEFLPSWTGRALLLLLALALIVFTGWMFLHARGVDSAVEDKLDAMVLNQESATQVAGASAGTSEASTTPATYAITFASTGDMIFGREVGTLIDQAGGAAPLENVASLLASHDVTIGNLENPLSDNYDGALLEKDVILIGRPSAIDGLKQSDFTFVSLANNHSLDYGEPALADTITALDTAGIKHAGAGMNYDEAWKLAETTVQGKSIAFLSFSDIIPENFLAGEDYAGIAAARIDMDETVKAVKEAKATHDIVIVAMHWGIEYQDYFDADQQQTPAHQIIDAGADVVLGNHPHVIQGIEFYKDKLITYSQGDFVFDHYSLETGQTFILSFTMTEHGIDQVIATPVYLDDTYGAPSVVTGDEGAAILSRLEEISYGLNSSFEMRDDKAYITNASAQSSTGTELQSSESQSSATESSSSSAA